MTEQTGRQPMNAPKLIQDEFSISHGSANFRLVWSEPLTEGDKQDLVDWLALVARRVNRLPVSTLEPKNTEQPHD